MVVCQFSATILCFKTDNGGEYIRNRKQTYQSNKVIRHDGIASYNHESTGIPESDTQIIPNIMCAMLLHLEKRLWPESCSTAVYLRNHLPYSYLNGMIPYEVLYHIKPEISQLHAFGTSCYIDILFEKNPAVAKLQSRAELGIFVGYISTSYIYRIQESNKYMRSVSTNESYLPKNPSPTTTNSLELSDTTM